MKRCFFDIVVEGVPKGRIAFELDDDNYPKSAENFYRLCVGDTKNHRGNLLHYKGSRFHNVRVDNHVVVGGDFVNGNGTGGESIYGPTFEKEHIRTEFTSGSLAMTPLGPSLNEHSSTFFIAGDTDPAAFPTSNAFGRVIDGLDLVKELVEMGDSTGAPTKQIIIGDCNAMP